MKFCGMGGIPMRRPECVIEQSQATGAGVLADFPCQWPRRCLDFWCRPRSAPDPNPAAEFPDRLPPCFDSRHSARFEELTFTPPARPSGALCDGWVLRASGTDTRRANSATAIGRIAAGPDERHRAYRSPARAPRFRHRSFVSIDQRSRRRILTMPWRSGGYTHEVRGR